MDIKIALRQAKAAVAKNDNQAAQKILKKILIQDPRSVDAWLTLAHVVENSEYKKECINRVLKLEPENKDGLEYLEKMNDPLSDLYTFTEGEEEDEKELSLELPNAYEKSEGLPGMKSTANHSTTKDGKIQESGQTKPKSRKKSVKTKRKSSSFLEFLLIVIVVVLIGLVVAILINQYTSLLNF